VSGPRRIALTGSAGTLGSLVLARLAGRELRPIDRRLGHELAEPRSYATLLAGCDAVVHLAALHPLIAPPDATADTYAAANVAPFRALLAAATEAGIGRLVLASSTSVWAAAPAEAAARFLDDGSPADGDDPYGRSKRACEALAAAWTGEAVVLRLARFATRGDPADAVRLLHRAIDPADAAAAVVAALDAGHAGACYAVSAPTPFLPEDAAELVRDPAAVIHRRTGVRLAPPPGPIRSVIRATRLGRETGWRAAHPSPYLRPPGGPPPA
jgi:nucleoside-diphosphate-sugar epimerase